MNYWMLVSLILWALGGYSFMAVYTEMVSQNKQKLTPKPVKYLLAAFWPFLVFWAFLEEI